MQSLPASFAPRYLPGECIENVILYLSPKQRFGIATDLRFLYIQKHCLPVVEFASPFHASRKGQCDLLERHWINKTGFWFGRLRFPYGVRECQRDVDIASKFGHINVLQWYGRIRRLVFNEKDEGVTQFNKSHWVEMDRLHMDWIPSFEALVSASANGHVAILEWWKKECETEPVESLRDIVTAPAYPTDTNPRSRGNILTNALIEAAVHGHPRVLQWWFDLTGFDGVLSEYYCREIMDEASRHGHVAVLQWWYENAELLSPLILHRQRSMEMASIQGHVTILQWWKEKIKPTTTEIWKKVIQESWYAIELAERNGHDRVVQWWKKRGMAAR